jgi:radical SAM-linked protein
VDSTPQRLRIVFGKQGAFKYIGHLDLAKTWERILRRAGLALAYTHGFNARPRMQVASPLPVGVTSECELLDIWLEQPTALDGLAAHLESVSPAGVPIYSITEVPARSPALQTLVESSVYALTLVDDHDVDDVKRRVADLLAQPSVLRTRREKSYDLRPLILGLEVDDSGRITARLALDQRGTGRPDELIGALGFDPLGVRAHRVEIRLKAIAEDIGGEVDEAGTGTPDDAAEDA